MNKVDDSDSSNDEETYQDYFTNPQKRKQFDNQRLYQQQKELQKMSGFNKNLVIDPPKRVELDNQRNYATVSLFCLTVTNPFRDKIIRFVLNQWFDRFILFTIVVNCVFLAIDDPNLDQLYYQIIADYIFLIIFTLEMCLKIVAMGFALRPYSYLRDAWNILDFIVVIMGWASQFLTANNVSAIRVIRILRPLRTINSMPGMRKLVQSLLNSLPTLLDILILFSFFLVMFGTIATQLFGGLLSSRCVDDDGEIQTGADGNDYFCKIDDACPGTWLCKNVGNPDHEVTAFDNILKSVLNIFIVITLEGWTDTMYKIRSATGTVGYDIVFVLMVVFGSFFIVNLMVAVQFSYLNAQFEEQKALDLLAIEKEQNALQKLKEETPRSPTKHANPQLENSGKFQEGFSQALDSNKNNNEPDKEISNNERNSETNQQVNQDPSSQQDKENQQNQNNEANQVQEAQEPQKKKKQPSCYRKLSKKTFILVESQPFNVIIIILILINTGFMAMEHYNMPQDLSDVVNYGNQILTCIFAFEMFLKILGLGLRLYVKDGFNVFDAIIVIVGLLEFVNAGSKALTVLRAFRLLRIFKIVKSWTTLKKLLQTVLNAFSSIANLGLLMFLLIFIYALIGMQFFSGPIPHNEDQSFRFNFDTFAYSLITIFVLLTAENWNSILIMFIDKDGFGASIYFVSLIIFGNIMVLNLFLAILLSFISDNLDDESIKGTEANSEANNQLQNEVVEEQFDYIQERLRMKAGIKATSNNISEAEGLKNNNGQDSIHIKIDNQEESQDNQKNKIQDNNIQLNSIKIEDIRIALDSDHNEEDKEIKITNQTHEELKNKTDQSIKDQNQQKDDENIINNNKILPSFANDLNNPQVNKIHNNNGGDMSLSEFAKSQKMDIDEQKYERINRSTTNQNSVIMSTVKSSLRRKFKTKGKNLILNIQGRSLFIFDQNSRLRKFLRAWLTHPYFENFVYHLIALNSLILAISEPQLIDEYQIETLNLLVAVISGIFIAEAIAKIIVLGFIMGKEAYLKDTWNILDFIIVSFSVLNYILDSFSSVSISFLRGFRALRALRPLRMVSKNEGMKIVVNSLLTSIPNLFNVMLISLLFYLVFGILGVQLFKGALGACNDASINFKNECVGQFRDEEDMLIDRQWDVPFNNFDNIFYSMCTFFEISTLENWPSVLFSAIDSQDIDQGPIRNNRPYVALLFVVFIFITTFFVMNLFISVIVDKFNEEIKKKEGSHKFSEEQKEWVKMQRIMVHVKLKIISICPQNKIRRFFYNIVMTKQFEFFISFVIMVNTLFLCMDYVDADTDYRKALQLGNIIFVTIFAIEAAMKMIAHGIKFYFLETWNKFDFVIVILSLVALDDSLFSFKVNALRIIRVARLLRMIKASKGLRHLLKTLWLSLGNIANVGMLLFLIFFTFTVAGMDLFGGMSDSEYITKNANFRSFYITIITLFRASTGENWNGIMHDCYDQQGVLAIIYWIAFELITHYIFLNVFIAVIYENFNDVKASEDENEVLSLKRKDIKAFVKTWALFCPNGEHYLKTTEFSDFLMKLPPPLGYEGQKIEQSKLNKIIFCLNIKSHLKDGEGKVYFPEVMWAIFHSIIGNNDEQVHNCEQVQNIMRELKRKYKGLGKYVTPDSLCGNKYYRTEMTVSKYMCALAIYKNWKRYQGQRLKKKELLEKQQNDLKSGEIMNTQMDGESNNHKNILGQIYASDHQLKLSDNSESMLLNNDHNANVQLKIESKFDSGNVPLISNSLEINSQLKKMKTLGNEEQKLQQKDDDGNNNQTLQRYKTKQFNLNNDDNKKSPNNNDNDSDKSHSFSSQSNKFKKADDEESIEKKNMLSNKNQSNQHLNIVDNNKIHHENYIKSFGMNQNQFVSQQQLNINSINDSIQSADDVSEDINNDNNMSHIKEKFLNNTTNNDENVGVDSVVQKKQVMIDFALIKGNMNVKDFIQSNSNDKNKNIQSDNEDEDSDYDSQSDESEATVKNDEYFKSVKDNQVFQKAREIKQQESNKKQQKTKKKKQK